MATSSVTRAALISAARTLKDQTRSDLLPDPAGKWFRKHRCELFDSPPFAVAAYIGRKPVLSRRLPAQAPV